ncbi:Acyl-CoA desaturase [Mycena kentingensis (nom. inval.)]|nr:Acyl-CoA desaturase [Mycena kentingensis (nom. inval.)]
MPPSSTTLLEPRAATDRRGFPPIVGVRWFNVAVLLITPLVGLYGLVFVPVQRKTAAFAVAYYLFSMFGITAVQGFHRLWSHRSYDASMPLQIFLILGGTSAVQGSAYWWAKGHRAHHRWQVSTRPRSRFSEDIRTDTDKDPYDSLRGLLWTHVGWILFKSKLKAGPADISDLARDPLIQFTHRNYFLLAGLFGYVVPAVIPMLWGDPRGGMCYAAALRLTVAHHCTFAINSIADSTIWGRLPTTMRSVLVTMFSPWFIATCKILGLASNLRRFSSNEIAKGALTMKLKELKRVQDSIRWAKEDLPVVSWEEFQDASARTPLILISGFIHDVSTFLDEHPGGTAHLMKGTGKDMTAEFVGGVYRHSNAAHNIARPALIFSHSSCGATVREATEAVFGPTHVPIILLDVDGGVDRLVRETPPDAPFAQRIFAPGEARSEIAFLAPSSGTTGLPKVVALSHFNAISILCQIATFNRLNEDYAPAHERRFRVGDVCCGFLPLYHIYGLLYNLHFMLYAGLTLVLMPKFSFKGFLSTIERNRITHLTLVGLWFVLLCKDPLVKAYDLSSVRYCVIAAAPLGATLTRELLAVLPNIHLGQGYGMTESCGTVGMFPLEQRIGTPGSAGQLLPGTTAKVVKEDGSLAQEGEAVTHPSVLDAAVIGLPDLVAGELPFAFVVLKSRVAAIVRSDAVFAKQLRHNIFKREDKHKHTTTLNLLSSGVNPGGPIIGLSTIHDPHPTALPSGVNPGGPILGLSTVSDTQPTALPSGVNPGGPIIASFLPFQVDDAFNPGGPIQIIPTPFPSGINPGGTFIPADPQPTTY